MFEHYFISRNYETCMLHVYMCACALILLYLVHTNVVECVLSIMLSNDSGAHHVHMCVCVISGHQFSKFVFANVGVTFILVSVSSSSALVWVYAVLS